MSWVPISEDCDFPIDNLPLGVFSTPSTAPRIGIAIGEHIIDCHALTRDGLLDGAYQLGSASTINPHLELGASAWAACRESVLSLLSSESELGRSAGSPKMKYLVPQRGEEVQMHLAFEVGDYTDFYCSREHAVNVGTMFRGADKALMDNWTCMPIAYHGRSSTISLSSEVRRPWGQVARPDSGEAPRLIPTGQLDFELELGFVYGGPANEIGSPIAIGDARSRIFGACLVNDWSARDVQPWEYRPLGPFTAKNFLTSLSPWVVPLTALDAARCPLPPLQPGAHPVLPYLELGDVRESAALDISLEVSIGRDDWRTVVSRSNAKWLYWSAEQMIAHHTVSGCQLRPGDLLASGTISGATEGSQGSMLELTRRGEKPIAMEDGTIRRWLEDDDVVVFRGTAMGNSGRRLGFGECVGRVISAALRS